MKIKPCWNSPATACRRRWTCLCVRLQRCSGLGWFQRDLRERRFLALRRFLYGYQSHWKGGGLCRLGPTSTWQIRTSREYQSHFIQNILSFSYLGFFGAVTVWCGQLSVWSWTTVFMSPSGVKMANFLVNKKGSSNISTSSLPEVVGALIGSRRALHSVTSTNIHPV